MQLQEAVTSPAYLLVGEKEGNDGKVKLTFGDDAERTGVYTGSFSVQNLSDSPLHYALSGKVISPTGFVVTTPCIRPTPRLWVKQSYLSTSASNFSSK